MSKHRKITDFLPVKGSKVINGTYVFKTTLLVLYLFKSGLDNTAKPGTENQLPERTRNEFSRVTSPVYSDVENLEKLTVNTTVCILNFIHAKTISGPTNNEARKEFIGRQSQFITQI